MSKRHTDSYPDTDYDEASYDDAFDGDVLDGEPAPEHVRRTAPPSVHLVALVGYLGGLALLAAGVAAAGGRWYVQDRLGVDVSGLTGTGLPTGALLVLGALLAFVLTRKLQRGRRWVRVLVLILAAASIANTLYVGLVTRGQANVLLGLVLPVIYAVLLNTTAARSWFRRRTY
jgi:hypothetical protein